MMIFRLRRAGRPKASLVKVIVQLLFFRSSVLIAELAISQTDSRFADAQLPHSCSPHLLSFSTLEHGRRFSFVEAKLGLPFL